MTESAFNKIAEGLSEAIAIAKGEKKPAKLWRMIPPYRMDELKALWASGDQDAYWAQLEQLMLAYVLQWPDP